MEASWRHEFKFETTAKAQVLSNEVALRAAFAVARGVMVCADPRSMSFAVRTALDASQQMISALVFTKSLPILGSPLGVRVSVVGNATDVVGDAVQQLEVSTSPPRVRNHGIDLMLDLLLDADADAPQKVRALVVRPQVLEKDVEISRVEVSAGAFVMKFDACSFFVCSVCLFCSKFISITMIMCMHVEFWLCGYIFTGAPLKWRIDASQLRALYEQLERQRGGAVAVVEDSNETAESEPLLSATSDTANASETSSWESLGVSLHELVIGDDGVALECEFELGGDDQRDDLHGLLEAVVSQEKLLQALVQLVPDAPVRVSAHLQPCSYTTTTALPKDAHALLMRILHHAQLACPVRLDSSGLETALMALRPVTLESWRLHDTAVSVLDVAAQVDTAEGKEEPSVRCFSRIAIHALLFYVLI